MSGELLVIAGEGSGDRAAAGVLRALGGLPAFGFGGAALESAGLDTVADLRTFTALGASEILPRALPLALAHARLTKRVREQKPRAALLVNFTEYNVHFARLLSRERIPTLLYVAPQVWAWRPNRIEKVRPWIDRLAVVLPFEEPLWRSRGVDAHYVGHPALETKRLDRVSARRFLGLTPYAPCVAILPGSRPHEVRSLLPALLEAYDDIRRDRASLDARVLVAPSLDDETRTWALRACREKQVDAHLVDPVLGVAPILSAFDVSLCASGTAALEAALARAVPVVVYKVGLATELLGRLLLKTEHLALPNVLLGRRAFPELVQRDVKPLTIAAALETALQERDARLPACEEVEKLLEGVGGPAASSPSNRVARLLSPWLT